ncbi:basic phospholipase A2 10-like [Hydractinia symbiolongicarpus]|uniref:basic phospholipase A2 10-like n=1 Tax=Hydractinia symbiolongicarpus TaxID=13093 RepID=UPI00254C5414|nr:basic phospholipase A2 10-like [Hydractinia symbiolongicarpus]
MKLRTLIVAILCVLLYPDPIISSLFELCEQIDFYSSSKLLHCLDYDDYGCWCGPGGSGTPVDGSDACCRDHDHCYDNILRNHKCNPYLAHYQFHKGQCLNEPGSCLYNLCKCDQAISICLSKNKYHFKYYGWRVFYKCR